MDKTANIRNITVLAATGHGRSALEDSLLVRASIIAASPPPYCDLRVDHDDRRVTVKPVSRLISFEYAPERPVVADVITNKTSDTEYTVSDHSHLINLIDTPRDIDCSAAVSATLRVTDGALVVVDCVDGAGLQTEILLRQALSERVRPVLLLNKVDRALLELHLSPEECYQCFTRAIESVNSVVATYYDVDLGDCQVYPERGTVAFGSGLHQWGFTLKTFAAMYSLKFGMEESKLMVKLWGDWFYDFESKKWTTTNNADGTLKRGFCQFIMDPIAKLFDAIMNDKKYRYEKMLKAIGVELDPYESELTGKPLLKRVMQHWLPATDSILEMVVVHLPSPIMAQKYRVETLYDGPMNDECATAIRTCDVNGPLVMYVSRMVPTSDRRRFYAFGRVFAGKVFTSQKVRILGPNYALGKKTDLWVKNIQRTVILMGRYVEQISDIPAGNTCALIGMDQYLLKSGTITTLETSHTIRTMKFSVSPVVRVTVEPKTAADLPSLVEGMKRLAKSDLSVRCYTEESGEHIIGGASDEHLKMCLRELQEEIMGRYITVSTPFVSYRETVQSKSSKTCMSKSPNRHNRLFCVGLPLGDELTEDIEEGKKEVQAGYDAKLRARYLADNHGWDVTEARKIWCYGPDGTGPNVFVDTTKGVSYLNEIKESVTARFQGVTKEGVLCGEGIRGFRVNLIDAMLLADPIHRGRGQIMPTTRRVVHACQLTAAPALMEPVYLVDIQVPKDAIDGCRGVLTSRRGRVFAEEQCVVTPMWQMKAFLPVSESWSLTSALRDVTAGRAFAHCVFDHYQIVPGDPIDPVSTAGQIVAGVRARKGLTPEVPPLERFHLRL